jgi:hypothetical protein
MKWFFKILTGAVLLIALIGSGWKFYDKFYFNQADKMIEIKCHYMMYACGECYPQWNIDSVTGEFDGDRNISGKDIRVFYKGKDIENVLQGQIADCIRCYHFYFKGNLGKSWSGRYRFNAVSYYYQLADKDCCN